MRRLFVPLAVSLLVVSCVEAQRPVTPSPSPELAAPVATSATAVPPASQPTPLAGRGAAPASAGSVPDAGVLYVIGADDAIYRYDGRSGQLAPVWRASSFDRASAAGVYAAGRQGGLTLLRWDGTTANVACGSGYDSVSASGACVSSGADGISVQLPGEGTPRLVLPADWGGVSPVWSPDGDRLLLIRVIASRPPGPGVDPGLAALWVLESDGRTREIYRPSSRGVLTAPRWSPDGRFALVRQYTTTSASLAADGIGTSLLLIEVATGHVVDLGIVSASQWGPRGQLAYVSGGSRMTWENKTLIVRGADGRERIARAPTDEPRVALAPAWDAVRGRLAWISGPALPGSGDGGGYIDGTGAGQRVAVIDDGVKASAVQCGGGRVAEGVRWSSDGEALLLLCRKPGRDPFPLEVWLYRLGDGTSASLVTGLVGGPPEAGGFGFYGAQPSLFSMVAWSRAAN